jgi:FkbM family methyltransferase
MTLSAASLVRRSLIGGMARFGFYASRSHGLALSQHLHFLWRRLSIDCVLDVGAHHGEYWRLCRETGFEGPIISFEPTPASYTRLQAAAAGDRLWHGYPIALGSKSEDAVLYSYPQSVCNSLSKPTAFASEEFHIRAAESETRIIKVRRLDEVIEEIDNTIGRRARLFVKVDTQGHDMAVLDGAANCLNRVYGIQTEVSAKRLYEESVPMGVALMELDFRGFDISGMFATTWDRERLRAVEFDCVLVRKTSPPSK